MEDFHWSVWPSLALSVVVMAWFLGGSPLDEKRWHAIGRMEIVVLAYLLVGSVISGLGFLIFFFW